MGKGIINTHKCSRWMQGCSYSEKVNFILRFLLNIIYNMYKNKATHYLIWNAWAFSRQIEEKNQFTSRFQNIVELTIHKKKLF